MVKNIGTIAKGILEETKSTIRGFRNSDPTVGDVMNVIMAGMIGLGILGTTGIIYRIKMENELEKLTVGTVSRADENNDGSVSDDEWAKVFKLIGKDVTYKLRDYSKNPIN